MGVESLAGAIKQQVGKAIAGQEKVMEQVLVAILANGHVLLEGVPGVAKKRPDCGEHVLSNTNQSYVVPVVKPVNEYCGALLGGGWYSDVKQPT